MSLPATLAAACLLGVSALVAPALAQAAPEAPSAKPDAERPARERRARPSREPSVGQIALRERQRKCGVEWGVEWKEMKAGGKVADGMKWPKFWSQCNARLKGQAA